MRKPTAASRLASSRPTPKSSPKFKVSIHSIGKSSILQKFKFITKMIKMQTTLREESEEVLKLKGVCPDHRIPKGVLLLGI